MDTDDALAAEPLHPQGRCCLCYRILPYEIETVGDLEVSLCGDCKLLFLEDSSTQQRTPDTRQTAYTSSLDSIQNMLSQQFANHESQSRSWTGVLSDTESDGFDSVIGEVDILSHDPYGSDSDASVDVNSFLDNLASAHPNALSYVDSDTNDDEFEEVEGDVNAAGSLVGRIQLHRSLATNGRNLPSDWLSEILSDEGIRNSERRRLFSLLEDQETSRGDYIDAETDGSWRGARPAAVSFVKNLELMVVNEESVCVICKDNVYVGTVMNRLPCGHVYHPSCILPWLDAQNTCPLCRYELPTDKDCEKEYATFEENNESGGGKWWFLAAPLVSVVAIGIVVWLSGGVLSGQRDSISRKWGPLL